MKKVLFLILISYALSSTHFNASSSPYTEAEQKLINEILKEQEQKRQNTARLNAALMNLPMTPKTRSGVLGYFAMNESLMQKIKDSKKEDSISSVPLSMPPPRTPAQKRIVKKESKSTQQKKFFFPKNNRIYLPIYTPRAATVTTQTIYNDVESWWREIYKDKYYDFAYPFIIEQDIQVE